MKRYSHKVRDLRNGDNKIVKFKDEMDALITSEEFLEKFRSSIEEIALYKRHNGIRYRRSTDYAAVGILNINDMIQEAYLAFLEAYANVNWDKVDGDGGVLWSYLKKSTVLNYERQLRGKKDGIKVPERAFNDANTNFLTKMFGSLEQAFSNNVTEVATSKWDTDLIGYFLEVHMDEVLDLTRTGKRDVKKNERNIIKALYGIDQVKLSYAEIAEYYGVSQSTIRSIKERAIKRLQSHESKQKIAHFLHEYRINTGANIGKRQ